MKNTNNAEKDEKVLFLASFEIGADILRSGELVCRVPPCTHWDDDRIRIVARNDDVVLQVEDRKWTDTTSYDTDIWHDIKSLGKVEGLVINVDHPRGCVCDKCY